MENTYILESENYMEEEKGRYVLMAVCIIGLLIMAYLNKEMPVDDKVFANNAYYIPYYSENALNEHAIYNAMHGGSITQSCKVQELVEQRTFNMRGLGTAYPHERWIFPLSYCNDTYSNEQYDPILNVNDWDNAENGIKLFLIKGGSYDAEREDGMSCSFVPADDNVWPVLAPFTFDFVNNNTDNDKRIIIVSGDRSVRMTIDNAVNWFCAGPYPETENEVWLDHGQNHSSIFGASKNAEIRGGSSGTIIGYVNANSKIIMEVETAKGSGVYKGVSIRDWITTDK